MTKERVVDPDAAYGKFVSKAEKLLTQTNQLLIDICYWNTQVRPNKFPDQEPIAPDPDGELARLRRHLYEVLRLSLREVDCPEITACGYSGEGVVDHPCSKCGMLLVAAVRQPV